jgi:alkanesulfonate monooxygenase SsuD/methylene tetrahydromethanopterin reductase-like flavin-dependent oxidoreductase (luciferase family)
MKFGLSLPNHHPYGDINLHIQLASLAEESGWDGYFLWDHYARTNSAHTDPWITMAAVACNTERMTLGIHVTPLSRRRPWKVAREIVTLDHLSKGRMIMGVGLGDFRRKEFENFGEVSDPRTKAKMLDEGIEIITGLQSGEAFTFSGEHYSVAETVFNPKPLQQPHVPVWVAGQWPNKPPFRRAARWDGVVPIARGRKIDDPLTPVEVQEMMTYIHKHRTIDTPFVVCVCGVTKGKDLAKFRSKILTYEEVGATWWIEFICNQSGSLEQNEKRIRSGPPK